MPGMAAAAESDDIVVQPGTTLRQRLTIYAYIGALYMCWPFSGVWGTKARFELKDQLHFPAGKIAMFLFLAGIPAYAGFVFGFVRDRWNPLGRRDQGLLIIFCGLSTALVLCSAALPTTAITLFALFICGSIFGQFIGSAERALTSVLGQEHLMSGRLSAVWQAAGSVPALIVAVVAGKVATHCTMHQAFLIGGAVGLAVTALTFWRPDAVYDEAERAPIAPRSFGADVRVLLKTKALYPIVAMLFLWNFTPGVGTPIQFYMTNILHGNAEDYGNFNAIFSGCFIPTFLLYGFLCTRVPSRPLIWICTLIAAPQILPMLIVHNAHSAMIAAIPMGLMGGPATAAYFGLLIRACPAGLQGTVMMLGASVWALSDQLGNLAGSKLFDMFHSFAPCAWATFFVYALLIPLFACVPKYLTATKDGEAAAT